jgi:hypothetical protein
VPYRNRTRDEKPWRFRADDDKAKRRWVYVSARTERRLRRLAKKAGTSRHKLADRLVAAMLDAVGA